MALAGKTFSGYKIAVQQFEITDLKGAAKLNQGHYNNTMEVSLPMQLLISLQVQLLSELPSHLEIWQHICLNLSRMMGWCSGIILTGTLFLSGDQDIIPTRCIKFLIELI